MKPEQQWILDDNNPLLRKVAEEMVLPISKADQELVDRMVSYIDTCYQDEDEKYHIRSGIALAGPQVGLLKQVIYIHFKIKDQEYQYLIANPKIVAESMNYAYLSDGEGCLSVKEDGIHNGIVKRRQKMIVQALDLKSQAKIMIHAEGVLAICLQHEIDHLKGILFYDRIDQSQPWDVNPEWIKY